jgi:hypothetical protein
MDITVKDEKYKWEPWEGYGKDNKNMRADIVEPPCKNCLKWKPQDIFNEYGNYYGTVCCIAENMEHDFSCFKSK